MTCVHKHGFLKRMVSSMRHRIHIEEGGQASIKPKSGHKEPQGIRRQTSGPSLKKKQT